MPEERKADALKALEGLIDEAPLYPQAAGWAEFEKGVHEGFTHSTFDGYDRVEPGDPVSRCALILYQ